VTAAAPLPCYSPGEEIANSLIHGLGIALSIAGLAVLTTFSALHGGAWEVAASAVFGAALILCYTTSTLYHAIPLERVRHVLRALDHSAIFLLIAGTYTPFMLISLGGTLGRAMLAAIWTLAVVGIAARLLLKGRRHGLVIACYLAMGWAVVFAIKPLIESLGSGGLVLLVAGGLAYTAGVSFYVWRRLPYSHAVWHGFVLAGSMLHFCAVLFYVIPWPETA
jgi:hemolysin III